VSVNWNHGGEYRPGPGEPLCDRLDMLLGHVVDGREMVDAELTKAEVVESRGRKLLRVEVLAKSRYQIGGATALIAKSTDRDFSLATGLEGLGEYGPTRGKNELGANYGGHGWVYKKPDGAFINPFEYPDSGLFARYPMKKAGGEGSRRYVYEMPFDSKYAYAVLALAWDTWGNAPEEAARNTMAFTPLQIVNEKAPFSCGGGE
jgi:hypothetical protein